MGKMIRAGCVLAVISILVSGTGADAKKTDTTAKKTVNTKKGKRKPSSLERPPQFVFLAFDGSKNLAMWDETYEFAESIITSDGKEKLRFTYFINPPYVLSNEKKSLYVEPGHDNPETGRGNSCIGFVQEATIAPRIQRFNRAFMAGHELASHANAHCHQQTSGPSGAWSRWSVEDWSSEFDQFNKFLFGAFKINGLKPLNSASDSAVDSPTGFAFSERDIVGFRAPQLEWTPQLYDVLRERGFKYDTSRSSPNVTAWPKKEAWGGYNLLLPEISYFLGKKRYRVEDGERVEENWGQFNKSLRVQAMDYTWYANHAKRMKNMVDENGVPIFKDGEINPEATVPPERLKYYHDQVLSAYLQYFVDNYYGKRAPVQIGHHFSKWMKGIYWNAMKEFAQIVCGKPEVRCVTMKTWVNWAASLPEGTYDGYAAGEFAKLENDNSIIIRKDFAKPVQIAVDLSSSADGFSAVVANSDQAMIKNLGLKTELRINSFKASGISAISRADLVKKYQLNANLTIEASVVDNSGNQVSSTTYQIENLGTPNEKKIGPLETMFVNGDPSDAHAD